MPGSEDNRTITGYRTVSRFYRRPPGPAWWLALLAIPLLLGLLGWAGLDKDADVDVTMPDVSPTATLTAPNVNTPEVNAPNFRICPLRHCQFSVTATASRCRVTCRTSRQKPHCWTASSSHSVLRSI